MFICPATLFVPFNIPRSAIVGTYKTDKVNVRSNEKSNMSSTILTILFINSIKVGIDEKPLLWNTILNRCCVCILPSFISKCHQNLRTTVASLLLLYGQIR